MIKPKYGIYGGAFNPIHNGHLFIAEMVREECGFEKIVFMPTGNPPHKKKIQIDDKSRYEMILKAVEQNSKFIVSDVEIFSDEINYTINTMKKLTQKNNIDYYFIIGADEAMILDKWKDIEELFKLCSFVVVKRPGFEDDLLNDKIKIMNERYNTNIRVVDGLKLDISSTDIRMRIQNNKSIRYLVPEKVLEYINKNGLYR